MRIFHHLHRSIAVRPLGFVWPGFFPVGGRMRGDFRMCGDGDREEPHAPGGQVPLEAEGEARVRPREPGAAAEQGVARRGPGLVHRAPAPLEAVLAATHERPTLTDREPATRPIFSYH